MPKIAELIKAALTPLQAKLICDGLPYGGIVPVGAILIYAGSSAPTGFFLCDGTAVSRTDYENLYNAIGTEFGIGDGSTTFNIPSLKQRFPLGKADSGTGSALGVSGGAINHTHTVQGHHHGMGTGADLAISSSGAHTHSIAGDQFTWFATQAGSDYQSVIGDNGGSSTGSARVTESSSHIHTSGNFTGRIGLVTGGGDGNAGFDSGTSNPPFLAVNYIIKY